ncbi:MAG: phage head-tail connector protein [Akkermansia sp.]|nr:phage head-tail connector protein [Akkermansia sp.]
MTGTEKLTYLKTMLGITGTAQDALLTTYLAMATQEILQFKYSLVGIPDGQTEVDPEDEITQIHAVVAGFNIRGAENQTSHNENQIYRTFDANDMVDYCRNKVIPYARVR